MADSNFRGPVNSMGSHEVDSLTANIAPLDGPSMFYQGFAYPDIRSAPFAKDISTPGQQPAFLSGGDIVLLDNIPQARGSTLIAAAQIATSNGSTVALVTAQVGGVASVAQIAVGVPIIPLGTTVATFANLALDFGFATGTTVTNSSAVVVTDSTLFRLGAFIVVGGAANAAGSRSLMTQVASVGNATTIFISPVAATGISNTPIGQGNLHGGPYLPIGTQFGPATASANAHSFAGGLGGGLARIYNPREMLTRNISITGVTAIQNAYSCVVSGWDVWGAPMTELISAVTGQTAFMGKKAFKYISSITVGTTVGGSQTVAYGLGDVIGLPVRADYWEELYATWNGVAMANFSGFTGAVTSPATSTTGDVRGTLQLSTSIITGGLATAMSVIASNGTGRVFAVMSVPPMEMLFGTPLNTVPMFGVAQSTATT